MKRAIAQEGEARSYVLVHLHPHRRLCSMRPKLAVTGRGGMIVVATKVTMVAMKKHQSARRYQPRSLILHIQGKCTSCAYHAMACKCEQREV